MASKLLRVALLEAENQFELSLRKAFEKLEPSLRPPFPLTIPNSEEYSQLNMALIYGVLSEAGFANIHIKHLHAIVTDGYALFLNLLFRLVNELYAKLLDSIKSQLLWVTREMIDVSALGIEGLLVSLLRQTSGDSSDQNLQLCIELLSLCLGKWDNLLQEQPFVLTCALYTFLRLLADHCRPVDNPNMVTVRRLETKFCIKMLREQFHICLRIGRDLIRLLQGLLHMPDFQAIWKDLISNTIVFKAPGFKDIRQIYESRTSSKYFLLRITPEMETQLRFMLTYVKLGEQKRHQAWFVRRFLSGPESETLLVDIVRFICCGHHPPNEIIQSNIIPRWAVIGWLMKLCRSPPVESNVKLALLYDWLFFRETTDNIMNIEPAILLMVYSMPQYAEITQALLEYLLHLLNNYDVQRYDIISRGICSAFKVVVTRGVIPSLDILTSSPSLSPPLKKRLDKLLLGSPSHVPNHVQPGSVPNKVSPCLSSPSMSAEKIRRKSPERIPSLPIEVNGSKASQIDACVKTGISLDSAALPHTTNVSAFESLVQSLWKPAMKSDKQGFQNLEAVLLSFIHLGDQKTASNLTSPEVLASKLTTEYEVIGYKLFAPVLPHAGSLIPDDESLSITAVIIRTFCFSQHEKMQQMLLYWSRYGFPVGARLLSYAARLGHEANIIECLQKEISNKTGVSCSSLLKFHADGYDSFQGQKNYSIIEADNPSNMNKDLVSRLVQNAFSAYRCFLTCIRTAQHNEMDAFLSKVLVADLRCCCNWAGMESKRYLFQSVLTHLPDLCIGNEDIVKLLIGQLDHVDNLSLQFDIRLKKIFVFGKNADIILNLINKSLGWDALEQHKFWGLLRSEIAVSCVHLEKIILEFFCSQESNLNLHAIAAEGLLALLSSSAPTPQLVSVIMLLPNTAPEDFAGAVLSSWEASYASDLFKSFAKVFESFEKGTNPSLSPSSEIKLNCFANKWILDHFRMKGVDVSNVLGRFGSYILG